MRLSIRSVVAGVSTLAVAGALAAAGAASAAAVAPPYDPDPDAYATVSFYDAAGTKVTSGNANDPLSFTYALADAPRPAGVGTVAGIFVYNPQTGLPTGSFSGAGGQLNANGTFPIAGAPSPVGTSANAASKMISSSKSVLTATQAFTANTGSLTNVYQVRLKSGGSTAYAASSITVDPTTGAWQQVYPVVPITQATSTTLSASPASPATAPATITLSSTTSPAAAGSVQFFNGATALGAPVTTDATGKATLVQSAQPVGSYSFTAKFTATDPTAFATSTSTAVVYAVQAAPAASTSVALTGPATINAGDPATYNANVTPAAAAGTIEFFDGTTSLGAPAAAPTASVTVTTLSGGAHSITAKFVSGNPAQFANSTSPAITTYVASGACSDPSSKCTDPQSFTAEVKPGTLVISTPFHASNPFNLGVLALNSTGTELSTGAKSFAAQDPAPVKRGITITDARSGNPGWTASLQSSVFTSGTSTIAAKNLGFTNLVVTDVPLNALKAADVSTFSNPAFSVTAPANTGLAASSTFATAAPLKGTGTVYVNGDFTLNAPTSTVTGIYAGTVTFTIS